jgi:hypothetical protein
MLQSRSFTADPQQKCPSYSTDNEKERGGAPKALPGPYPALFVPMLNRGKHREGNGRGLTVG